MPTPPAVAPTYDQVVAAWNAQADEHNQWGELGEDEKIEWAVACAKAAPPAVGEPLTDEQKRARNPYRYSRGAASIWLNGFAAAELWYRISIKKEENDD